MAMNLGDGPGGKKRGVTPEMNVTPLVDVVLVLLIIFMVITPLLSKHFWIHTPKQEKEEVEHDSRGRSRSAARAAGRLGQGDQRERHGGRVRRALERLKRMFAAREDHIVFFDAADDVGYGYAVEVMDQAREGSRDHRRPHDRARGGRGGGGLGGGSPGGAHASLTSARLPRVISARGSCRTA